MELLSVSFGKSKVATDKVPCCYSDITILLYIFFFQKIYNIIKYIKYEYQKDVEKMKKKTFKKLRENCYVMLAFYVQPPYFFQNLPIEIPYNK